MDSYKAYTIYKAIHLHFTQPEYDAFKYSFRTRISKETFIKRPDKYIFQKLAKKYPVPEELVNFFVANYVTTKTLFPADCSDESYLAWLKINSAIEHWFKEDLEAIFLNIKNKSDFKSLFKCIEVHPEFYNMYLERKMKLESFIIFDSFVPFIDRFDKEIKFRTIWQMDYQMFKKYKPFVKFNKQDTKGLLLAQLEQLKDSNG